MADLPPNSDRSQDTGTSPGMPRWVKVFGIIVVVLVLLFVISMLAGVRHGPGMHTPSGDAGGRTPTFSAIEEYIPSGVAGDQADRAAGGIAAVDTRQYCA